MTDSTVAARASPNASPNVSPNVFLAGNRIRINAFASADDDVSAPRAF